MPAAERDAVRNMLDAVTKVTKLGDSIDAERNKHVIAHMANLQSATTALKAQMAALEKENKKRGGNPGDTTAAAKKKKKTEEEKATAAAVAASEKKAKGKNGSFSPSESPGLRGVVAEVPAQQAWPLYREMRPVPHQRPRRRGRSRPGVDDVSAHQVRDCEIAAAVSNAFSFAGWLTSLLRHGVNHTLCNLLIQP